ncbi:MAG: hypothetical protein RLZZ414_1993 [Bacteroidota bacterium]|jgi:hypothetical protein
MSNTKNRTLIYLDEEMKKKAKQKSKEILGKENLSALITYLINKL